MMTLRYYTWLCYFNIRDCLCGKDDEENYVFSPQRNRTLELTTEQYQANDEQMNMTRSPDFFLDNASTVVSPRNTRHTEPQAHDQNDHFIIQFDAHSTKLFQEAVVQHHKVHKAAKRGAKDLESLVTELQYLRRRLYGLRLAVTYDLEDSPDMLPLAKADVRRISARIDEIEEVKEKLENTLTTMYKNLHEGQQHLFRSLGCVLSKQGLMPQKFQIYGGSVASTASDVETSKSESAPESITTNPYSSPLRSNHNTTALHEGPTLRRKSAVATFEINPDPETPTPKPASKQEEEVQPEAQPANASRAAIEDDTQDAVILDDTPKTTVVKRKLSLSSSSWPTDCSFLAHGVHNSPEAKTAIFDILVAVRAINELQDQFDNWEATRDKLEKARATQVADSSTSSQTHFDHKMLRDRAYQAEELEYAEIDLQQIREKAVKEFGVVMADAESGFGGTWTGDGYPEDLVGGREVTRCPHPFDSDRVERWVEGVWESVPGDEEEALNSPALDLWPTCRSEIELGDSCSCVAEGKDRRRIDNWKLMLEEGEAWKYRRSSSLSVI